MERIWDHYYHRKHLLLLLVLLLAAATASGGGGGKWELLQRSVGVSAMHMQLLRNDRVILFDRTDFGRSNLSLPGGRSRHDPSDRALADDPTAHSAEYDVAANAYRPLTLLTDTWCSSGSVAPDGTLVQTGGWNDGERAVRTMPPCAAGDGAACDWSENPQGLAEKRWYATNQILPDGRAVIVGGRRQFSYEFYPKASPSEATTTIALPFLAETKDPEENNLYPFVHLNIDGNLFVFANNRAVLLDYRKNRVVRTYPRLPGGDPRSYPSSGSSVLLPLRPSPAEAEVLVCGGAPAGSYNAAKANGTFLPALATCGRLRITDAAPAWAVEAMPAPRVMGDMVLLPNGADVLILNGAEEGTAGWELAGSPAYAPFVYRPDRGRGDRFAVQSPTGIARLYHSSAVLLRDGRVLVGGSNPHVYYNFSNVQYPTELSLEAFSPEYLDAANAVRRPKIVGPSSDIDTAVSLSYGAKLRLQFALPAAPVGVAVTMVAPSFTTHSFAMNQRLLFLDVGEATAVATAEGVYEVSATSPATAVLAPPGYYMVFVVNGDVPSEGIWVHIQ